MALSGATGVAALSDVKAAGAADGESRRDYYELRQYEVETERQQKAFDRFARDAAIPALNRAGISPVGVFEPADGFSPIYVLLRHPSLQSVVTLNQKLADDDQFVSAGGEFIDAPSASPAYARVTSSLMVAFTGLPQLETPIKAPGRVLQLRIYESPSVTTGQKKIEMFNRAEIDIFRKTGLNPVFFGETLVGDKMPNLTYMLMFNSMEQQKANWKRFVSHPEWKALKSLPEYADKRILSNITNLPLKPKAYSQI